MSIVLFMNSPAFAQSPNGIESSSQAEARKSFALGKSAYEVGDYELAEELYLKAHEIYPHPLFLYNIAQAKRLSGDHEGALRYYNHYLRMAPDGPASENSRSLVASLLKLRSVKRKEAPSIASSKTEEHEIQSETREAFTEKSSERGRTYKITAGVSAAVGVLAFGASTYWALEANSIKSEISSYSGIWTEVEDKRYESGKNSKRKAYLAGSLGVIAVASSALFYYLGEREQDASSWAMAPTIGSSHSGLVLQREF